MNQEKEIQNNSTTQTTDSSTVKKTYSVWSDSEFMSMFYMEIINAVVILVAMVFIGFIMCFSPEIIPFCMIIMAIGVVIITIRFGIIYIKGVEKSVWENLPDKEKQRRIAESEILENIQRRKREAEYKAWAEEQRARQYYNEHRIEFEKQEAIESQKSMYGKRYFTEPCPNCGHYKVRYATWDDKRMSVAFWGSVSYKIGKRFTCDWCKDYFN